MSKHLTYLLCGLAALFLVAGIIHERDKQARARNLDDAAKAVTALVAAHEKSDDLRQTHFKRNATPGVQLLPPGEPPVLTFKEAEERGLPLPVTDEQMNDPVWRAARIKELKIARYHKSPAKDTEACQAVVTLLEKDGLGLEAVQAAYEVTWENKTASRMMAQVPEGQATNIWRAFTGRAVDNFRAEFPSASDETVNELLKIVPEVFYGNPVLDMPIIPSTVTVSQ